MKVKLEDILEGMELQSDESMPYLNLETGGIVYVSSQSLGDAEDGEDIDHLPDWQQDEVKIAIDIIESFNKYIALPSSFDIHEYDMMERFCFSLPDHKQDRLLNAIRGRGAFRRFKDKIHQLGVAEQWYDYRDQSYKEIAKVFCESRNIYYME